jgi:pimeloyl-ACP methyl ester carboxylesterase
MRPTLIALHGFTLNGALMRRGLGPLAGRLEELVELDCPDAPNTCSPGAVDRLYARWDTPRLPPPHLCWWDSSDDGLVYHGWEETLGLMRQLLTRQGPVGVLGFSQGAMLAATLAALSSRGEIPPLAFAVVIAGSLPRAPALRSAFDNLVKVPSLHLWGERDQLTGSYSPALAWRFEPTLSETVTWPGGHSIPSRGEAAERLVEFVTRQTASLSAP